MSRAPKAAIASLSLACVQEVVGPFLDVGEARLLGDVGTRPRQVELSAAQGHAAA
jgi:hypothetical protein